MTKARLYFSDKCPDTEPFVKELVSLGIEYEEINITDSVSNLKLFLSLRDNRREFDSKRDKGQVGIPVLVTEEAVLIFDETTLLHHYQTKGES